MGLVYLSTLIFLIIRFRKMIMFTSNNYLPLIFILFFSYTIPLFYGLIKVPVLTDRYIIFVLIPILILISVLIFEINNRKLRIYLLLFILIPTLVNNYIEIKFRKNTKPEFTKLLNNLEEHESKNLTLYTPNKIYTEIVKNYITSVKEFKNNNFRIFDINNLPSDIKVIWTLCYKPLVNYNCNLPEDEKKNWVLKKNKEMHLLNARLYEIIN